MNDFIVRFGEWLRRPFSPDMSAAGWFMFFGLLVIISIAWAVIMNRLVGAGRVA